MCSGERPMSAAKGKQTDTMASCPLSPAPVGLWRVRHVSPEGGGGVWKRGSNDPPLPAPARKPFFFHPDTPCLTGTGRSVEAAAVQWRQTRGEVS